MGLPYGTPYGYIYASYDQIRVNMNKSTKSKGYAIKHSKNNVQTA